MWFIFAAFGAFFKALTSFFRKDIAGKIEADVYMLINFLLFFTVLIPFILLDGAPVVSLFRNNWPHVFGASITSVVAVKFSVESLKREELSYIAPLNAFIPIFTLFFAWLALGELPPLIGLLGIVAVFFGAYIVNLKPGRVKWYEPILHVLNNTGARFGLGVAVAFALNTVILKSISDYNYSAVSIMIAVTIGNLLLLSYVPFKKPRQIRAAVASHPRLLVMVAISSLLGSLFAILALEGTFASYAISVRRLDIIFSVLLGWHLLKETNIRNKLAGSALMTVGVAIIALA